MLFFDIFDSERTLGFRLYVGQKMQFEDITWDDEIKIMKIFGSCSPENTQL